MELDDTELAVRVGAGDREALGIAYQRYGDRIFDFCYSMLHQREEAADATQEVFLIAAQKMGMLRDPSKMKSWLYAVARNDCLRRIRRRSREVADQDALETLPSTVVIDERTDPEVLRELVWSAAEGLAPRDRALLDLHVRQGLNGAELADAIGVKPAHVYVMVNRLKAHFEKAMTALLVARLGRSECVELDAIMAGAADGFSPLIRKRVAHHIEDCEICEENKRRFASPLTLLSAVAPVAAPVTLRARIVNAGGSASGGPGNARPRGPRLSSRTGFPKLPVAETVTSAPVLAGAAAVLVVAIAAASFTLASAHPGPSVSANGVSYSSDIKSHGTSDGQADPRRPYGGVQTTTTTTTANDGGGPLRTGVGTSGSLPGGTTTTQPTRVTTGASTTQTTQSGVTTSTTDPTQPDCAFGATHDVGLAPTSDDAGYWITNSLGEVAAYGDAVPEPSTSSYQGAPIVSISSVAGSDSAYYLLAQDGTVLPMGGATNYGEPMDAQHPSCDFVSITATPSTKGYWVVTSAGGIYAFGDASFYGSASSGTFVGFADTPDGKGYWEVGDSGQVLPYGDATANCSSSGSGAVAGLATTWDGAGYWVLASDGAIFDCGDAHFYGSPSGQAAETPLVAISGDTQGNGEGYWVLSSSGTVYPYGSAKTYPLG